MTGRMLWTLENNDLRNDCLALRGGAGQGGHVHIMARKCCGDSPVEKSRPSPEACLDTPGR